MKILVAHPAQQHSYRLATALKRIKMLDKYATTVYYKKGNCTYIISKVLKGNFKKKAEGRHCNELSDDEVIQFCELEGLLKLVALNTKYFKKSYNKIKYNTADRFAKKVAHYAIKNNVDAVITYDDSSPLLFEILKEKAPTILRIMDMSAANILYMKEIYEKDLKIAPNFANRLKAERSICWDEEITDRALREIRATQKFLVPSKFVAKSLRYSGVKSEQMYRCPYGVDISEFTLKEYPTKNIIRNRPIKFIYVGGVKELKGISYLLEAFQEIPSDIADLTVVGIYDPSNEDIRPFKKKINFIGSVLHTQVANELKKADVYVFASLGEGLSLSTLEAAACGLPLIVTENSGINDEMTEGVEGFVIPIQSKNAIVDKVLWFAKHPEKIESMGRAARKMAQKFSWDSYYSCAGEVFKKIDTTYSK